MTFAFSEAFADARHALGRIASLRWKKSVNRLIRMAPRPLIHPEARLIVIFSPKSACSNVVIWFLHQLGKAEEAREHNDWPHLYRRNVYCKSSLYREACDLPLNDFRVVRIVRDPLDRAASSFRHALRTGLGKQLFGSALGRPNAVKEGVSFREYLDALDRIDLTTCNTHFRIQRHPVEDKLPVTHLINVTSQDLYARLNEVEADLGLPVTDFAKLEWLQSLSSQRGRFNGKIETDDAYDLPLTADHGRVGPWPHYRALLTPVARERLARLYAADIAAYGAC